MLTALKLAVLLPLGGKHTVFLLGGKHTALPFTHASAPELIHEACAVSLATAVPCQDATHTLTARFACCCRSTLCAALKASAELGKPEIVSLILKQYPEQSKNHCKAALFRALK